MNEQAQTDCPRCRVLHRIAPAERGELIRCASCGWGFVALPTPDDALDEAKAIIRALWRVRASLTPQDERFVTSWAQAFLRRGDALKVGRFRLEHLRRTFFDNRHLLEVAKAA